MSPFSAFTGSTTQRAFTHGSPRGSGTDYHNTRKKSAAVRVYKLVSLAHSPPSIPGFRFSFLHANLEEFSHRSMTL